jgi:hypothetical protein
VKGFWEYIRLRSNKPLVFEDIFIDQGVELQSPVPGSNVSDVDLTPKEKQNKFKKKQALKK